ncbi:MAG: hypothetical protein ACOYZ8_12910 [Chloroflexota bacterium]
MPVNIKVIHTKDFIKTTVTGILDFAVSKQALLDIVSQIEQPGEYEILVDTREAEIVLSVVDIVELGQALAAHFSLRRNKIAVLASMSDAKQANFLETTSTNRAVRLRVFTDFERAITWLVMREST